MPIRRLNSTDELLDAVSGDAFARASVAFGGRRRLDSAWSNGSATAWVALDGEERRPYVNLLGLPPAAARLLTVIGPDLPAGIRATVPRGTPALLGSAVRMPNATDWDFRWTDRKPVRQTGEERVSFLLPDAAVASEIASFLAVTSPSASALPGDSHVRRWAGVRDDDGHLLAVAADTSPNERIGHLSAIAVRPDARGRGLGAAITAWLTRALFADGVSIVTLGLYAENATARRLYTRLGYRDEHWFSSGPVQRSSDPNGKDSP